MENEYVAVSITKAKGDLSPAPAYILSKTCSEKFLGRCIECSIPEIEFCKQQEKCEIPHKIVQIKIVDDVK